MTENIYSASSNFDMKNNSIFTQLSQEEMVGGDDNTISEFNIDKLFDDETIVQNGGNEFSATSTFHNQIISGIFSPTSSFKGQSGGKFSETSSFNVQNGGQFSETSSFNVQNGGQFSETSSFNVQNSGNLTESSLFNFSEI